jgi:DNA (cytosine-5)-methyltransferase 1
MADPPPPDISRFAIGDEAARLAPGQQSEKFFNLVKPAFSEPCATITAAGGQPGIASVVHPTEPRKLSIAELRRICSFPDDFQLTGTFAQQWERLGRTVPPLMMKAIAETVRDKILRANETQSLQFDLLFRDKRQKIRG